MNCKVVPAGSGPSGPLIWKSARSRGRRRMEPAASPWRRCVHHPQPLSPSPPPHPGRRRPPEPPGSRRRPQSAGRRCVGLKGPRPGSSSPCAARGAPVAPCSSWAGRGRSVAGSDPLRTPAGSPPG